MADTKKLFISYSSKNRELVRILAEDVETLGYDPWFDQQDIQPGSQWWQEIIEGIINCDIFLFAATPDSLESEPCRREREYARKLKKPFLPLALTDLDYGKLPEDFAKRQFISYRPDDKKSYVELQRALSVQPDAPPLPDPLPTPPEVPISDFALIRSLVTSSETLDVEMQKRLVYELGARREQDSQQVESLLLKLRKRSDTLTVVSDNIDKILGTVNVVPVVTQPELDEVLQDRDDYPPFKKFIQDAQSLNIYGASAIVVFNQSTLLRSELLEKGGRLRVMLQNPDAEDAVAILQQQLDDDGGPFLAVDIRKTLHVINNMREEGHQVECRLLGFSPGFSLAIVDLEKPSGRLNVEFLGFSNISIHQRMHIHITKERSTKWFKYWVDQYEAMWASATPVFE